MLTRIGFAVKGVRRYLMTKALFLLLLHIATLAAS